jgi:hypothetical protein
MDVARKHRGAAPRRGPADLREIDASGTDSPPTLSPSRRSMTGRPTQLVVARRSVPAWRSVVIPC